jgi:hypothetical protein
MSLNWYATRRMENVWAGKVEEKVAQKVQLCSTEGCERQSAFTGRKKDARCEECLAGIIADVDLEPLEAFPGTSKKWWLTRCRTCKAECHYRLETLLDKRAYKDTGCARCHWADWAKLHGDGGTVSVGAQRQLLDKYEFDPIGELSPLSPSHAVLTKCRACGIQAATRIADLVWGCHCTRVTRTGGTGTRKEDGAKRGAKNLFVDSDSPALSWWDHEANPESELKTVTVKATREAHWICPDCAHPFPEQVFIMAQSPRCPACLEVRRAERERLQTVPVSDVPALWIAWDDDDADPREVMVAGGGNNPRRFICNAGHHPRMNPYSFLMDGCSICRGLVTRKQNGRQTLASALPEIAAQWHPTRNGTKVTPEIISPNSTKSFAWRAACCADEWEDSVRNRDKYQRWLCPQCKTILHSFGWQDPGLAAEWSPENPITPWHLRPFAETSFLPQWICSVNSEHQWEVSLASRSSGSDCPECQIAGKSKVELEHFAAAKKVFSKVRSGAFVRDKAFATKTRWSVDILVEHEGTKIAIEYDGAHWHKPEPKILTDRAKSLDLLAAGYLVIRLREDDLPSLDIKDPRYVELQVYSTAPQPEKMIVAVDQWHRGVVTSGAEG